MKSTFRILFYVKRDKQRADGTAPIMCRITVDGQASRFNTKMNINPVYWDAKAAAATGRTKEAMEINSFLNEIKTSIYNIYHNVEERQDFSEEIKLEEIDLRIAMKVREILKEKENIKQ